MLQHSQIISKYYNILISLQYYYNAFQLQYLKTIPRFSNFRNTTRLSNYCNIIAILSKCSDNIDLLECKMTGNWKNYYDKENHSFCSKVQSQFVIQHELGITVFCTLSVSCHQSTTKRQFSLIPDIFQFYANRSNIVVINH